MASPRRVISRPITWLDEGFLDMRGGGVWVDDMNMGTSLLIEHSLISGDTVHLEAAGFQLIHIANLLQDTYSGLMKHGYHYWTNHHSCCFWGRGNGWAIVAFTEFLAAADQIQLETTNPEMVSRVLELYNSHISAIFNKRSAGGLWHNIMNNNSTFQETSASAMFLTALSRGYRNGWMFDDFDYTSAILESWDAIKPNMLQDGTITNIIGGTGIQNNEAGYAPDSTDYQNSSPGVGAVLRVVAEMSKFGKWLELKNAK